MDKIELGYIIINIHNWISQAQGLAIWRELIKRLVFSIISGFDRMDYFEGLAMDSWLPNKNYINVG